jgi:hypothetical protein
MTTNVTVTVSKKSLIVGVLVALVVGIFVTGLAVTPFDKAGKAVLLTTENRRIKAYLDNVQKWQRALDETRENLISLLPPDVATPEPGPQPGLSGVEGPTSELWEPAPAGGAPLSVYEQNEIATAAVDRLAEVSTQVERAVVPQALQGTHVVVCQAVNDHLQLANLVLDYVGAPDDAKLPGIRDQQDVCRQDTARLQELIAGDENGNGE